MKQNETSVNNKQNIYISTLNTRTLRTQDSLYELEDALQTIKWDIVGLCEIRRSEEKIEEHEDYIFYYKNETPGLYGVGFIIKKYLRNRIQDFIGISDRIAILNIDIHGNKQPVSIIQLKKN